MLIYAADAFADNDLQILLLRLFTKNTSGRLHCLHTAADARIAVV